MSLRRVLLHRWRWATFCLGQRHVGFALPGILSVLVMVGCDSRPTTHSPTAGKSTPSSLTTNTPATTGVPWLQDVSATAGFRFLHDSGARGEYFMPEHIGSGVAVLDVDSDGLMDLYCVQNGGLQAASKNQLFRQVRAGVFTDASKDSGLDIAGRGMGAIAGDINNDGRPDIVVTEFGATRVLINETRPGQPPRFREITLECGVDNPRWATAASFIDYDRDGWLDLVVGNYVDYNVTQGCTDATGQPEYCGPDRFAGTSARLFRNLGESNGRGKTLFRDVTLAAGLASPTGPALGILCVDMDGDRWPDIFMADDGKPNRLFMNQRNGTFREEAISRGLAYNAMGNTAGNMGIAYGDIDDNGWIDLFITHLAQEQHGFWIQDQRGLFLDRIAGLGLVNPAWRGTGFGAALVDLDRDGALDLAWVNGDIRRGQPSQPTLEGLSATWTPYAQRAQCVRGTGRGRFEDISLRNPDFTHRSSVGRGLAIVDFDNDGAPDLVQTSIGGPAQLFRNICPNPGHWLGLRLIEPLRGGRDAIGAEVAVETQTQTYRRWLQPAASFLSSHDPRIHVGLGNEAQYQRIRVLWPDGSEEIHTGGAVDQFRVIRHGEGVRP